MRALVPLASSTKSNNGASRGARGGAKKTGMRDRVLSGDILQKRVETADAAERRKLLEGWQVMYCGGSAPVVKALKEAQEKWGFPLKIESFAW